MKIKTKAELELDKALEKRGLKKKEKGKKSESDKSKKTSNGTR